MEQKYNLLGGLKDLYKNAVPTNVRAYLRGISGETSPVGNEFFTDEDIEVLRRAAADSVISDRKRIEGQLTLAKGRLSGDGLVGQNLRDWYTEMGIPEQMELDDRINLTPEMLAKQIEDLQLQKEQSYAEGPMSRVMGYDAWQTSKMEPTSLESLIASFSDPVQRMKTTIGGAMLERDADDNVFLTDKYNFNHGSAPRYTDGSVYGMLHKLGERFLGADDGLTVALDNWQLGDYIPQPKMDESKGYPIRVNLGKWGTDVPVNKLTSEYDFR